MLVLVTTVLLIVPVTLLITEVLKVSAYPYLFGEIFAANIGGAATLIGDPPNIMTGWRQRQPDRGRLCRTFRPTDSLPAALHADRVPPDDRLRRRQQLVYLPSLFVSSATNLWSVTNIHVDNRIYDQFRLCLFNEEHLPVLWQRPLFICNFRFQCICVQTNLIHRTEDIAGTVLHMLICGRKVFPGEHLVKPGDC